MPTSEEARGGGAAREGRNSVGLRLHIPAPRFRPGAEADFSHLEIPEPGTLPLPDIDASASETLPHVNGLVRVLGADGLAHGPWDPELGEGRLVRALRAMRLTSAYDQRMYRMQRQGKTSFYVKSTGEEAVSVGAALALDRDDMLFPTYRQQGLLIARDHSLVDMMCQIYSNAADRMRGRQLPVFYSSRESGFFTISGNLGTQLIQAVGWAMGSAYSEDTRIAATWTGEGATAEADFHHAMVFASVYQAPVVINVVNNQWAISSFSGIAGGERATFAARAIAYGVPGLRVDGNDLLAVHSATAWAAARARANLGPTLIELFTYRAEGHSTSDDPSKYRAADEFARWPLGDPVTRLRDHMLAIGAWDQARDEEQVAEVAEQVKRAGREAEAIGTMGSGEPHPVRSMFEDVYAHMPWHLREQCALAEARPWAR